MPRSDLGHDLTEAELGKVQRRIEKEFSAASRDMQKTAAAYFKRFEKRDAAMLEKVKNGVVSQSDYDSWRLAQIGRGDRLQAMATQLAERSTDASEAAIAYGNGSMAKVYALNRNYAAYTIERSGANIDFNLLDEYTVKRLAVEAPDLMPYYPAQKAINRGINLAYGKRQVTKIVTSGILQGLPVRDMAKNLASTLSKMEMSAATRAVRTAVTGAENGGRMDSYSAAGDMGIKMEKEWMSTLDSRTRDSHRDLDGVHVATNKKFPNGLMYPGDPGGIGSEVYNCRCTMVAWFPEIEEENNKRVTYRQWEKDKSVQGASGKGLSADKLTGIGNESVLGAIASYMPTIKSAAAKMAAGSALNVSATRPTEHTQEELNDLSEFARSQGIRIANIQAFDGDSQMLREQIAVVRATLDEYGVTGRVVFHFDNKMQPSDMAETKGNVIHFNSYALRNREVTDEFLQCDNFLASTKAAGIGIHECGHIIAHKYGEEGLAIAKRAYYNLTGADATGDVLEALNQDISLYSAKVEVLRDRVKSSDYKEIIPEMMSKNATNPNEFSAEFIRIMKEEFGIG